MSTKRALVCAPLLPEYDRESGSRRIFHLVEFLREAGWAVSYMAQNGHAGDRYVRALQQRGVATFAGFDARTDQIIANSRFDLAVLATWYLGESYMPAIREISPSTRVVVDTGDLHFLRDARRIFREPIRDWLETKSEGEFKLTADPNPVPAGFGLGATTISWSLGDEEAWGQVYVSEGGGPEVLFAEGAEGSEEASWISPGETYEFRLYGGAEHSALLATATVTMDAAIGGLDSGYAAKMVREVNTYAAADAVLAVSQKEADLVNNLIGDPTLAYTVPDCEDLEPSKLSFAERKGILFIGNFRHPPNIDALEYACKDILPRVNPDLMAEHPVYIVGNALDDKIRGYGRGLPHVHMVGWVPSVLPYLAHARISILPLTYGAGTKRKLVQALMVGTPSVSTSIGVEGLDLRDGEHVLVADDPETFADSIARLLEDPKLWRRLVRQGRKHIAAVHGREAARTRLMEVVSTVLSRAPKLPKLAEPNVKLNGHRLSPQQYQRLVRRIRETVRTALPPGATVVVVSRGDDELLQLDDRRAWHFPRSEDGQYAGYYPADDAEAIAQLEGLREEGAEFLLFPETAFWWLEDYLEFKEHLESRYRIVELQEDICLIIDLREPETEPTEVVMHKNEDAPAPSPGNLRKEGDRATEEPDAVQPLELSQHRTRERTEETENLSEPELAELRQVLKEQREQLDALAAVIERVSKPSDQSSSEVSEKA